MIYNHIYYSLSIFFVSQCFFLSSSFLTLFPNPKELSLSTHSYIHIFIPPPRLKMCGFVFSLTTSFTCYIKQLSFETTPIFITITFVFNPFSKLFFYLWLSQPLQFQFLSEIYFHSDLFWAPYRSTKDNVDPLSLHLGLL